MRVLFMGTPDFAVPCLEILIKNGYEVCGAVTQPDKPKGRGHKLVSPSVKVYAEKHGIPVFQPQSLKNQELLPILSEYKPDIAVVVAYGRILPEYILNFPMYGCINVHASLLPRYRGAAPIQRSVINGDEITGVTTMYMEKGLDTGDMIFKSSVKIGEDETYGELHDRLSLTGADLLIKTLDAIAGGSAPREKQNDEESCYAPMISKETGHIDWSRSASEILNLIRGTNPWPMSYTMYGDEVMKIIRAERGEDIEEKCGSITVSGKKLIVACGGGTSIVVDEIQFKGGKRMRFADYLNGHTIDESIVLK